jgi:hypothetical protein
MIEFSTGVVFLMSSLYGSGHANSQLATVARAMSTGNTASTSELISLTNSVVSSKEDKNMNSVEAYIRKEFADTPILIEIARCESQFHQFNTDGSVVRGMVNKQDVGVMQINEKYHAEYASKLGYDLYSTEGNVAFGKLLYSKYGSDPWVHSSKCWGSKDIAKN